MWDYMGIIFPDCLLGTRKSSGCRVLGLRVLQVKSMRHDT